MPEKFDPARKLIGNYQPLDGTIEFYERIRCILEPTHTVLDLGAGRGSWYFEDSCETRRRTRALKPLVHRLIGADVDPMVMENRTTTDNLLIENGSVPLPDQSVDVIVADYVLEHVQDVSAFSREVNRLLKPGGYFCARTPHSVEYVSLMARIVRNERHSAVLNLAQAGQRREQDVFPTVYRMNSLRKIREAFPNYSDFSYLYSAEPAYYFGNRYVYSLLSLAHRLMPRIFVSNIFAFLRKPSSVR